jgi:hypothetical protein
LWHYFADGISRARDLTNANVTNDPVGTTFAASTLAIGTNKKE